MSVISLKWTAYTQTVCSSDGKHILLSKIMLAVKCVLTLTGKTVRLYFSFCYIVYALIESKTKMKFDLNKEWWSKATHYHLMPDFGRQPFKIRYFLSKYAGFVSLHCGYPLLRVCRCAPMCVDLWQGHSSVCANVFTDSRMGQKQRKNFPKKIDNKG